MEGVEGNGGADVADEMLDKFLEKGDVADTEALDYVLIDDKVVVIPEDLELGREAR